MRECCRWSMVFCCWIAWGARLWAQTRQLQFEHAFDLGAPGGQTMLQAQDGFLWIGTEGAGIFRYDGYELRQYGSGPDGVSDPSIFRILEDRRDPDIFWIATLGGLNRFDTTTETFTFFKHDPNNPASLSSDGINDIVQDSQNPDIIWIATNDAGFNKFDMTTGEAIRYHHDSHDPQSLMADEVWRILEDRQNSNILWIAAIGGGLEKFEKDTECFTHYRYDPDDPDSLNSPNGFVGSLIQDKENPHILWLGVENGLERFDTHTEIFTHYVHDPTNSQSLRKGFIGLIYDDGSGRLWLGGFVVGNGLTIFDKQTETFTQYRHDPRIPRSISNDYIVNVYEDGAGMFWITTYSGAVDTYDPRTQQIALYQHSQQNPGSLGNNTVNALYEDSDATVWLGTQGGLSRFDAISGSFTTYTHDPDDLNTLDTNYILGMFEDSSHTFWISQYIGPLLVFARQTGRVVTRYAIDAESVTKILEDPDNPDILWMGTRGKGLATFEKSTQTFTFYPPDPQHPHRGSSSNYVYELLRDHDDDVLWLGSWYGVGLSKFNTRTKTFTHYVHDPNNPASLSANAVATLYQDTSGTLWIGTKGGGLDKFNKADETFTNYGTSHGIPADVNGILEEISLEETARKLWLSTNQGILCFDLHTETIIRRYDVNDGLQGNNFLQGSALKTRDGHMWFGGTNGVNRFAPDTLTTNTYIPPVVLTRLTQAGQPILNENRIIPSRVKHITLNWQQNFFEFEYAALNFIRPQKNHYKYMLQGFDREWYNAGTVRAGRYSGLPGGTYTLRIIGSNNDGIWNEEGVSLRVTVVPPFWQTWWFSALLVFVIIGSLAGGTAWRVRTTETRRKALEAQVRERTRELEVAKELALEAQCLAEDAQRAAEAANRSKSNFLANMSHELRTPLNAVLGFSQLLARSPRLTPHETEDVNIILRSGNHLLTLINQLLDISKIEAGRMTVHERHVDLYHVLAEIEHMFRLLATEKHLQFLFERDEEVPQFIRTDDAKLRQVLFNLLNNALKFTTEGGIAVRVRSSRFSGDTVIPAEVGTPNLHFEIEDTGPGIAPEDLDRIFDAFEQTESGYHTNEGTGLGLPISRNFIRLMGGELTVKSRIGVGTLFSFYLPVTVLQAQEIYTPEPMRHVVGIATEEADYRILVVDDKYENRRILVKLLEPLGFHVREAQHGQEAIDIWDSWEPHFIWMDMRMPVLDGYKATEQIKATTKGQATAIVALTASAFEEEKAVVLSAGCDDFLRKPFKEAEIFDMLRKHLGVEFVYEEKMQVKPETGNRKPEEKVSPEALAALPKDVYVELCKAVDAAELKRTVQVIEQVRSVDVQLADILTQLIKEYRFDTLQRLLGERSS